MIKLVRKYIKETYILYNRIKSYCSVYVSITEQSFFQDVQNAQLSPEDLKGGKLPSQNLVFHFFLQPLLTKLKKVKD